MKTTTAKELFRVEDEPSMAVTSSGGVRSHRGSADLPSLEDRLREGANNFDFNILLSGVSNVDDDPFGRHPTSEEIKQANHSIHMEGIQRRSRSHLFTLAIPTLVSAAIALTVSIIFNWQFYHQRQSQTAEVMPAKPVFQHLVLNDPTSRPAQIELSRIASNSVNPISHTGAFKRSRSKALPRFETHSTHHLGRRRGGLSGRRTHRSMLASAPSRRLGHGKPFATAQL